MPDKITRQTKVTRKTLNPIFEETFEFGLEREHLENRFLIIDIFNYDKNCKHECIGFAKVPLNSTNIETKKILLKEIKPSIKLSEVIIKNIHNEEKKTQKKIVYNRKKI
jgi:Ca2+-dependent lipid-binding protein